ncbi:glycosyltransferase family A protein [Blastococcus sp. Marseille-P5729]|uniref:glycosyltransferase family A protein n=1 Tax=Blastococcus sp. Marseille-P5729 TaxID=2086582 RepID=UPI000D10759B|nr:glycosyltransferase family A protein [Blastococcus sp. Marseille-P5729]
MLTIITATFNRRSTLPRLYASLCRQTSRDFEWVVIDDGSTDDTTGLLREWQRDEIIDLRYFRKLNEGKHVAVNLAVSQALGDFSMIVDSDDWLATNAVELVTTWAQDTIGRPNLAGVSGLKNLGNPPRLERFPREFVESSHRDRLQYGLRGDLAAEAYRTNILREFPFPVYSNEKFMHEAVVWNRIADAGYVVRWYPVVIYYAEYQPGGLTRSAEENAINSFEGFTTYMVEASRGLHGWRRFRLIGAYGKIARVHRLRTREIASRFNCSPVTAWLARWSKVAFDRVRSLRRQSPGE